MCFYRINESKIKLDSLLNIAEKNSHATGKHPKYDITETIIMNSNGNGQQSSRSFLNALSLGRFYS